MEFAARIDRIGKLDPHNDGTRFDHPNGTRIMKPFYNVNFGHPMPAELLYATTVIGKVKPDKNGRVVLWVDGKIMRPSDEFKGTSGANNVYTCSFPAWGSQPLNVRLGEDNRGQNGEWDLYQWVEERYCEQELGTWNCPLQNKAGFSRTYVVKDAIKQHWYDIEELVQFRNKQNKEYLAVCSKRIALELEIKTRKGDWDVTHPKYADYVEADTKYKKTQKDQEAALKAKKAELQERKERREAVFDA